MHRKAVKSHIPRIPQEKRREQVLEEQKRKRAFRINAYRNLEVLASLSLGPDEDEDDHEIVQDGVSDFVSMLEPHPPPSTSSMTSNKRRNAKPSKYAEKCMYAELLELGRDSDHLRTQTQVLPSDLQTNWIALAPVPKGKRCLAVAHMSHGNPGSAPTVLHSRLKGKVILAFPSPLPPDTILDCILDENWKQSGLLHVLDVVRWHGQTIGDGECVFRFWWRDSKLSELPSSPWPSSLSTEEYQFAYPTNFVSVPSHSPLSLEYLSNSVIPLACEPQRVAVHIPLTSGARVNADGMDVDSSTGTHRTITVRPDGILLYHGEASYEPGTSPLSLWVPAPPSDPSSEDVNHMQLFAESVADLIAIASSEKVQ